MKTIYFSRHGKRIDRHAPRKWKTWIQKSQRWFDPPITEQNIPELEAQAKTIPNLDYIYCSPFLRCVQTAHVYACIHECPIYIENGMCEFLSESWFNNGGAGGWDPPELPRDLISPSFLKYTYYTIEDSYKSFHMFEKQYENRRDIRRRVANFCKHIERQRRRRNILLVGHGISTKYAKNYFGLKEGMPQMGVLYKQD
jgi:broad specificity phosphatase PhoE